MISKNLADSLMKEIKETKPSSTSAFNLNFKIDGQEAYKFDQIAKISGKSRTELAKFIIFNSLDDLFEKISHLNIQENQTFELTDEAIINLARVSAESLPSGSKFELKELFGSSWDDFGEHGNKNKIGKIFRKLIDSGRIDNIRFICIQSNRHALYEKI